MLAIYLLTICVVASDIYRVGAVPSSVRITTIPNQDFFRIGQTVQFSCEVEPVQSDSLTYQWRIVNYVGGGVRIYFSKSVEITYYAGTLRYCWYFCTVRNSTGAVLGSANTFFEVHGVLQTNESVSRAFSLHETIVMKIYTSDFYSVADRIGSLGWFHNGTKLVSDDRIIIGNNGSSLTILNMTESDAGKYEVRINSIVPASNTTISTICDMNILPVLENAALYAPVTFLLQKSNPPTYNPEAIIVDYVLPAYQCPPQKSFIIDNIVMVNAAALLDVTMINEELYKDGVALYNDKTYNSSLSYDNVTTQSLRITYSNTDDIAGYYMHQTYIKDYDINANICPRYLDYIFLYTFPVFTFYWNIRSSNTPILYMWSEKSVLTAQQMNTIECDVVNCISANISLWSNQNMLVQIHGSHLRHQIKISQFGTFTCQADNISNSSLVQEKAQIQLLLEATELTCCGTALGLQISMTALMNTLCEDCNIDVDNFEEIYLKYSTSGKSAYFTADLIYSNSEGTVTSSTLITRLWSWLLTEETPNITISGYSIALSKKCSVPANSFTKGACMKHFLSSDKATTSIIVPVLAGGLTIGILMGAIGATSILLLLLCLYKRRCKTKAMPMDPIEEEDMSINLAYGNEGDYMDPSMIKPLEEIAEHVYDYPEDTMF